MPSSAATGFLHLTEEVLGAKKLDYTTHLNKLESFTAGTMRNLILVALILKAVLADNTDGLEFGDIISMQRCVGDFTYTHFAVYVGENEDKELGKKVGDNIFERSKIFSCPFSRLKPNDKPLVANYLDEYIDKKTGKVYKKGSDEEIKIRIKEKYGVKCGAYDVQSSNCEHLATYVRYGVKVALQLGQTTEGWCKNKELDIIPLLNYARESTACEMPSSSVAGG